jgi:hypothetical protein
VPLALFRLYQIVGVPYAELGQSKKVFAGHECPHLFALGRETEKTKSGIVGITKEFKARQELRFDLLGHGLIAPSCHTTTGSPLRIGW